ncbi:MAG: pyridoxal 5'-phosphate synthase glutaminase subunit PdxT [Candidatus Bipolaricaulota bacterium]|nr:pyridoxal 5'-phosphate synthase glutaminase subunit PdxT [Candidatus Bipolaricaulota bacterium]
MTIGVLGLQGAVREHVKSLDALGVPTRVVKSTADLDGLSGLILPGGESTAIALLGENGVFDRLRRLAAEGLPMFGTCAGMILLARDVEGRAAAPLGAIDITVARNASGRQVHSFETTLAIDGIGDDVPAVFIRAPYITRVGAGVRVLARHAGVPVMATEGRILVASFHPELTEDLRVHRYFVETVCGLRREGERG